MILVDTCGWIEWLTNGQLSDQYEPYFNQIDSMIVPTSVQFNQAKLITSDDHFKGLVDVDYFEKKSIHDLGITPTD